MENHPLPSTLAAQSLLSLLLGMALGLLAINVVQTLGLDLAVHEEANGAGKDLLGLGVVVRVAYQARVLALSTRIGVVRCTPTIPDIPLRAT